MVAVLSIKVRTIGTIEQIERTTMPTNESSETSSERTDAMVPESCSDDFPKQEEESTLGDEDFEPPFRTKNDVRNASTQTLDTSEMPVIRNLQEELDNNESNQGNGILTAADKTFL